jgi:16S rRNA G966 N2-methylase RsmD
MPMIFFTYLKYYFYLGIHWNFKIATVLLLEEIRGEKKYGISTTGADELKLLKKQGLDISHATIYMPVSYSILEEIFVKLPINTRKHFLDIGSGKGRALSVAAIRGFKKVSGIDFSEKFCKEAEKNLQQLKAKGFDFQSQIINSNAKATIIPTDADCIFLFNPFDKIIMTEVVRNIMQSYTLKKRTIYICYVNPLHKDIFIKQGFKETHYSKKMHYLELSILAI